MVYSLFIVKKSRIFILVFVVLGNFLHIIKCRWTNYNNFQDIILFLTTKDYYGTIILGSLSLKPRKQLVRILIKMHRIFIIKITC